MALLHEVVSPGAALRSKSRKYVLIASQGWGPVVPKEIRKLG
jgi:hypothetical protein